MHNQAAAEFLQTSGMHIWRRVGQWYPWNVHQGGWRSSMPACGVRSCCPFRKWHQGNVQEARGWCIFLSHASHPQFILACPSFPSFAFPPYIRLTKKKKSIAHHHLPIPTFNCQSSHMTRCSVRIIQKKRIHALLASLPALHGPSCRHRRRSAYLHLAAALVACGAGPSAPGGCRASRGEQS